MGLYKDNMRPLKYKNLGEMRIIRVPNLTTKVLPHLQEFMQEVEECGEDSVEILLQFLEVYRERTRH